MQEYVLRGSGARRVVLYARVSTGEQARNGYSLAQQIEALRTHAARAGDEILEEVTDPGESGAQLVRPGMDRVRDLVAVGGVSAVLAQDADRLSREPEHLLLLSREFGGRGCRLEVLGDGAADDGRLAAYERAKLTERSRRGKLRKAREGKVVGGPKPNFGFRFNEARDGYLVQEGEMRVVRRIFRMVGAEGRALNAVKRALEAEGAPTPSGKGRWLTHVIRGFVLNDVYRPHPFGEVSGMVTPEVAARLDPDACYGVWWFNRERWTRRRVAEASGEGRAYRWRVEGAFKPKEEWIAVPVPDPGIRREVVDAARGAVLANAPNSSSGDRFWELSGILRCGACGRRMRTSVARKPDRSYFYYACALHHDERDACPNRKSYRADALEPAVRRLVGRLIARPERVRAGLDAVLLRERDATRGGPDLEEEAWLGRLAETERMRSGYQKMTARGLMTLDELGAALEELERTRRTLLRELEEARARRGSIEALERERDALLEARAASPETLERLEPEERHRLYRQLRLGVHVGADGGLTVSGAPGTASLASF